MEAIVKPLIMLFSLLFWSSVVGLIIATKRKRPRKVWAWLLAVATVGAGVCGAIHGQRIIEDGIRTAEDLIAQGREEEAIPGLLKIGSSPQATALLATARLAVKKRRMSTLDGIRTKVASEPESARSEAEVLLAGVSPSLLGQENFAEIATGVEEVRRLTSEKATEPPTHPAPLKPSGFEAGLKEGFNKVLPVIPKNESPPDDPQSAAFVGMMPVAEQSFCDIVNKAGHDFQAANLAGANQLKLSKIRGVRASAIVAGLPGGKIKDWVGTIDEMTTTGDGLATLKVRLPCGLRLTTWNNDISDILDRTLIPQASPVYDRLSDLDRGRRLRFSANLVPDKANGAKELSVTEAGSMTDPEFLARFTDVAALP